MKQIEIRAMRRQVLGKRVRALRRAGVVPAHLFGRDIEPEALQVEAAGLDKVLARAGTSRLVSLVVEGDREPRNVLVKEVQRDCMGDQIIHIDFYQVRMTDKIKVEIPVVAVGDSPAVKAKLGVLMQAMRSLPIECLPAEIPQSVQVDVSGLTKLDDGIYVRDLKLKDGITVLADPDELVIKVSVVRVAKEEVVKPVEAAGEVAAAAAGGGVAEGAKAEGGAEAGGKAEKTEKAEKPEKGQKSS